MRRLYKALCLLLLISGFTIFSPAAWAQASKDDTVEAFQATIIEPNMDRPGADLFARSMPYRGVLDCQRLCEMTNGCRAFTFVRAPGPGAWPICKIKSAAPPPKPSDCCVSGVKDDKSQYASATPAPAAPSSPSRRQRIVMPSLSLSAPGADDGAWLPNNQTRPPRAAGESQAASPTPPRTDYAAAQPRPAPAVRPTATRGAAPAPQTPRKVDAPVKLAAPVVDTPKEEVREPASVKLTAALPEKTVSAPYTDKLASTNGRLVSPPRFDAFVEPLTPVNLALAAPVTRIAAAPAPMLAKVSARPGAMASFDRFADPLVPVRVAVAAPASAIASPTAPSLAGAARVASATQFGRFVDEPLKPVRLAVAAPAAPTTAPRVSALASAERVTSPAQFSRFIEPPLKPVHLALASPQAPAAPPRAATITGTERVVAPAQFGRFIEEPLQPVQLALAAPRSTLTPPSSAAARGLSARPSALSAQRFADPVVPVHVAVADAASPLAAPAAPAKRNLALAQPAARFAPFEEPLVPVHVAAAPRRDYVSPVARPTALASAARAPGAVLFDRFSNPPPQPSYVQPAPPAYAMAERAPPPRANRRGSASAGLAMMASSITDEPRIAPLLATAPIVRTAPGVTLDWSARQATAMMNNSYCFEAAGGAPEQGEQDRPLVLAKCRGGAAQTVSFIDGVLYMGGANTAQITLRAEPVNYAGCLDESMESRRRAYQMGVCKDMRGGPAVFSAMFPNTAPSVVRVRYGMGMEDPGRGHPLAVSPVDSLRPALSQWEYVEDTKQFRLAGANLCIYPTAGDVSSGAPLYLDDCTRPMTNARGRFGKPDRKTQIRMGAAKSSAFASR